MTNGKVYHAIRAVMEEMSKHGITKGRKNQAQGYTFRGIDDVYNALSSALIKGGLVILPSYTARTCVERTTAKGGALFAVTVDAEFTIASTEDGSREVCRTIGEAMDSGDKATNKAMSAAYKYMAMQLFCIPTEGDNDADETTHEVTAQTAKPQPRAPEAKALPPAEDIDPFELVENAVSASTVVKSSADLDLWVARVAASKFTGEDRKLAQETFKQLAARFRS